MSSQCLRDAPKVTIAHRSFKWRDFACHTVMFRITNSDGNSNLRDLGRLCREKSHRVAARDSLLSLRVESDPI